MCCLCFCVFLLERVRECVLLEVFFFGKSKGSFLKWRWFYAITVIEIFEVA